MNAKDAIKYTLESNMYMFKIIPGRSQRCRPARSARADVGQSRLYWQIGHLIASEVGLLKELGCKSAPLPDGVTAKHAKEMAGNDSPASILEETGIPRSVRQSAGRNDGRSRRHVRRRSGQTHFGPDEGLRSQLWDVFRAHCQPRYDAWGPTNGATPKARQTGSVLALIVGLFDVASQSSRIQRHRSGLFKPGSFHLCGADTRYPLACDNDIAAGEGGRAGRRSGRIGKFGCRGHDARRGRGIRHAANLYRCNPPQDVSPLRARFGNRLGFNGPISKKPEEGEDAALRTLEQFLEGGIEIVKL